MSLTNMDAISRRELSAKRATTSNDIAYSIGDSAFGKILVARSVVGVCAVLIGSDDDALTNDLAALFPTSGLISNEPRLRGDLNKVVRLIERPEAGLDLPLDMRRGTPFQRRVWDALRAIPCGAMVTYAALARRIGEPNAARAVASACAANAIALGIPCHRVVRSNGTLSGYRWGIERKRALIEKEARA
ncbi:methylated-DNA--[protein]-cysteine S-methyltransferase [Rhizobium calliandrae]|uniref:Methylated-DNA--[protein]-cysteine S-methyltransferase n=1 Tax=Rhizobium calliandrae TaxID=1312182 RepID=A0ABT7KEG9_9HYPH|nr:methylated-DNA--[protein]-cysteine S-methyltransferase [Rhizobium calliandrae]MDL2407007.1 methylated-DNA--[protein]-cysteine S-methyltransferase [Rhizobium calliandrae]